MEITGWLLRLVSFSALTQKRRRLPLLLTGRVEMKCSQMHVGGLCRLARGARRLKMCKQLLAEAERVREKLSSRQKQDRSDPPHISLPVHGALIQTLCTHDQPSCGTSGTGEEAANVFTSATVRLWLFSVCTWMLRLHAASPACGSSAWQR